MNIPPKRYTKYLQLRNRTYFFRYRVPTHLRHFTAKRELVRSLRTDSFDLASALVSSRLPLIDRLSRMSADSNELQLLFDELTDFRKVDRYSGLQRSVYSSEIDGMSTVSEFVADDLREDRITDFSGLTSVQPSLDRVLHKDFQRLFVMLVEAKMERIIAGVTSDFEALIDRAQRVVEDRTEPPRLLSVYYEKFKAYKQWTKKDSDDNDRKYTFLFAIWGDIDLNLITKARIKAVLSSYELMPVRHKNPYKKMSVEQCVSSYILSSDLEVPDEDYVSSKTVKEMLKFLQSFFSSYLVRELDLWAISPTEGVAYEAKMVRGGYYADNEVNEFLQVALDRVGWEKWSILLAVYTGARRGEIIKFLRQGVERDKSGILFFRLREGKTESAIRRVPVHARLIELGVESMPLETVKDFSITRYINALRDELAISRFDEDGNKRVFHSFRHSFITKALTKNNTLEVVQEVVGHSKAQAGVTNRYTHKMDLAEMRDVVDSVEY